jgi:tape measure domain-containing protein
MEGGDQDLVATIDDKVVAMSFESSKFESGVNKTISSLDKLKQALHFPNAGKGFDDLDKAAKKVDFGVIGRALDAIKQKLAAFRLVGIGVLTNLANRAVAAGARFAKAFTLDPIIQGFQEYSTNLNAIQTILANTQASGADLQDVNKALQELNEYSDKTIYNFSQMAKNIGTFTAAGVGLKPATAAIKGIANLAALSGSNSEQASTAMYQLSQAIAAGRVSLMDWNSVVNAGMGGTVFQRALANTAVAMGTLNKHALKLVGPMKNVSINGNSFRQAITPKPGEKSWLTSDVLTKTLAQFTGDLTDAELAAQGFNDAQIAAIQQTAKTAMHAATEVKTISQVFDVAKETAGSGWAQTFQIIFGNFTEAKKTFTDLSNTINGFINTNADARNKVLADWKALGGRTLLINSIKTAFHNLGLAVKPIKEAFRDIFPATTGKDLYNLTLRFKAFAEALKPSPATIENLRRTFRGFFALLDIGKQIISGIFGVFGQLFGVINDGSGSFLNFTGNIGDFLVSVDKALKEGGRLEKFFDGLAAILAVPLKALQALRDALANLFGGFSSGGFSDQMGSMTQNLTPFQRAVELFSDAWNKFLSSLDQTGSVLEPAFDAFVTFMQGLGPAINTAISHMNFEAILQVIRTGLLGALVLMLRNFFGKGSLLDQVSKGFAGGIMGNITGAFGALEGSMKALQTNIKAKTLKEIAIAIALLTASVVALSFVDPKKLNSALASMTIMFGQLLGAMAILDKISKSPGFIKLPLIAASLVILAAAIDLLTIAVLAMSRLDWSSLIKGLGGVAVLLTGIAAATGPLSRNSAGMIRAGIGISAIAVGLNILALAVGRLGKMSLATLGKGLGAIAIGLTVIAIAAKALPPNMLLTGAGLIAVSVGLRILADVVEKFGGMSWKAIGKGMAGIGAALVVIAVGMQLMPPNLIITAAGLILVSLALGKIASAVQTMGGMSIGEIAKGLITLALSLGILAAAMLVMQGAIGGAVALTIAAAGIALLAPALAMLGGLSWKQIVKGLVALAAVFAVIGAAGILLSSAVPALIGFGAALVLIGAGLALAGAGIALIGIGLSAIVVAAPTAVGVIVQAFVDLQKGIIKNAKLLILGLLEVVDQIAKVAPRFVDALIKILGSLLDAIPKLAPKLKVAIDTLLQLILDIFRGNQDKIIQAGFDLIIALLKGINRNLPAIVTMVAKIVITLLNSLAKNLVKIQAAGLKVVTTLVRGIISNYNQLVRAGIDIVVNFVKGIANNYARIIAAALSIVTKFVSAIANNIGRVINAGANLIVNFVRGISNAASRIVSAGTSAIGKFINAIVTGALKLVNTGALAIIRFLNGVATAIDKYEPQMIAAGIRIGVAIVTGMIKGVGQEAQHLYDKITSTMKHAKDLATHPWKAFSPSKVMVELGQNIIQGLAIGISDDKEATDAMANMSDNVINTVKTAFQITSPSKVMAGIGKEVASGFAVGLRKGTADDIRQAFSEMNAKISDAIANVRQTIASEQAKINEERKKQKKERDPGAIRESQQIITQSRIELAKLTAGHNALTGALVKQKNELIGRAKDHAALTDKIETEKQKLEDLVRVRDDAFASYKDQYSELPDVTPEDDTGKPVPDPVGTYKAALQTQINAVNTYAATLQKLRGLGLDDETYKKLLAEGPEAQAFASQLLAGGKTAVQSVSALSGQLQKAAGKLASQASANLYQAGVNAQAAIVKGLTSDLAGLEKAMEKIATAMIKALKKKLKIKSPSEVFAEIGQQSSEGMAKGLTDSSKLVTDAAETVADDALTAMRDSLKNIQLESLLNTEPVITPVLDLTAVQAGAARLAGMVPGTVSFGQASAISSAQLAAQNEEAVVAATGGTSVKFEQNNYSPESLTEIEIYRQTKNQLSQLKTALALT